MQKPDLPPHPRPLWSYDHSKVVRGNVVGGMTVNFVFYRLPHEVLDNIRTPDLIMEIQGLKKIARKLTLTLAP
jgi:hypothetical protein